jgi:DNA-binding MarR family transcriptional regulator
MAHDRPDLGVLLHRLTTAVAQRELPLLRAHRLEMWDYVVLGGLENGSAPNQVQLAVSVSRDKTRLIGTLDRLEDLGLLHREPDPFDRRNRVVSLTAAGRSVLAACRADIRAMETDLLVNLTTSDRAVFIRALLTLADTTSG